jgi:nicotinamidase-related amidase
LIIDIQSRLCAAMPQNCLELTFSNVKRLSTAAQKLGIPIIATEQYPKGLGDTRKEVVDALPDTTEFLEKTTFSCCSSSSFKSRLLSKEERPQIILAGMESHICVLQTAAGLQQWGYEVYVVADAVCSRNPVNREYALHRMLQGGISVTCTESVVFEWLGDATHPEFKALSKLFR